jgi:protein arginine kinase
VERVSGELISQEKRAREVLLGENERQMHDRVGRALGILKGARILGLEETMSLLSALRLGVCLGLVSEYSVGRINELMIQVQPAHLTVRAGHDLDPLEIDSLRADIAQKSFSSR